MLPAGWYVYSSYQNEPQMPQQESIGSIDSQVSAIFIEALYGPTIDNRIIPNLDKMVHVTTFGLLAYVAGGKVCSKNILPEVVH